MSDSAGEEYLSDDHPETPTKQNNLKDQSVETLESKAEKIVKEIGNMRKEQDFERRK